MKTKQETFNAVWLGLASQGWEQSTNQANSCLYRSEKPDGTVLKCAAGHLIPDSRYMDDFEYTRANDGIVGNLLFHLGYDLKFVGALQRTHDGEYSQGEDHIPFTEMNPQELEKAFRSFAEANDLTVPA